ncbi:hypothetical protein [Microbacterium sp. NPDC056234]|uniref:hypothetical protein n=1 Tax=Microbacterium sp. NPDC056234 TaxID=3345757 RepID=UPI0035DE2AA5
MRMAKDDGVLVAGAHRSIRSLAAGEGPWQGTLVTDGDDVGVWCDIDPGECAIDWRFTGASHVAAPTDVARSATGHGALMPWCTTRVTAFLAQRTAASAPLEPGEWVTLVLSMLRGLREIAERADPEFPGQWWLTDAGRPLCVPGGTLSARDGVVDILASAQTACADRAQRRILRGIQESVADSIPTGTRVRAWERELLDFAAPRALQLNQRTPHTPQETSIASMRVGVRETPQRRRVRTRRRPVLAWCAQLLSRALALVPRRERRLASSSPKRMMREQTQTQTQTRARRRPMMVAAASAAAVLCAGLLWPDDEPASSLAVGSAIATPVADAPTPRPSPDSSAVETRDSRGGAATGDDGPLTSAAAVLAALDDCAAVADDACTEALSADSTARVQDVLRSDAAAEPALVDDYGDLAVIRLGSDETGEQMLVLVRQNEKWLVRDVYDVADQPEFD